MTLIWNKAKGVAYLRVMFQGWEDQIIYVHPYGSSPIRLVMLSISKPMDWACCAQGSQSKRGHYSTISDLFELLHEFWTILWQHTHCQRKQTDISARLTLVSLIGTDQNMFTDIKYMFRHPSWDKKPFLQVVHMAFKEEVLICHHGLHIASKHHPQL